MSKEALGNDNDVMGKMGVSNAKFHRTLLSIHSSRLLDALDAFSVNPRRNHVRPAH